MNKGNPLNFKIQSVHPFSLPAIDGDENARRYNNPHRRDDITRQFLGALEGTYIFYGDFCI